MTRFGTYGAIGFSGLAVMATLDHALGLGGGALLADICRTILDEAPADEMGGMAMEMEIKPVPLIGLSLSVTLAGIAAIAVEHRRAKAGFAKSNEDEGALVLRAMVAAASSHQNLSHDEFQNAYHAVTGEMLASELADFLYRESRAFDASAVDTLCTVDEACTSVARRRALAAAMMVGCLARQPNEQTFAILDRLQHDLGASGDDVAAARAALEDWSGEVNIVPGVSLITLLRGRRLRIRPVAGEALA